MAPKNKDKPKSVEESKEVPPAKQTQLQYASSGKVVFKPATIAIQEEPKQIKKTSKPNAQMKARGKMASYLVKTYWKIVDEDKFKQLLEAALKGEETVKIDNTDIPISDDSLKRIALIVDKNIKSIRADELKLLQSKDDTFDSIFTYSGPDTEKKLRENATYNELFENTIKASKQYNKDKPVEDQTGVLDDESESDASSTQQSQLSEVSAVPTLDMRLIDKLQGDQKTGAMYVINKGTMIQQMDLIDQLQKLPGMDDKQKALFESKLKRFSNLSRIGDSANKLYAQALLDKRRQLLEGQLVLKTKQKVKK